MVCYGHIITNHILGNVTQIFGVVQLLALAKPSKSIRLIAISEGLHWLVSRAFCFQFHDAFFYSLIPPSIQHCVKDECETMVHNI